MKPIRSFADIFTQTSVLLCSLIFVTFQVPLSKGVGVGVGLGAMEVVADGTTTFVVSWLLTVSGGWARERGEVSSEP